MDRELIIRAAIHVGLTFELPPTKLIEFANLIAAAEREECAKVCEKDDLLWGHRYAAAIRSRT